MGIDKLFHSPGFYVNELFRYYDYETNRLSNDQIKTFLLWHNFLPGSFGFSVLERYYNVYEKIEAPVFTWMRLYFAPFLNDLHKLRLLMSQRRHRLSASRINDALILIKRFQSWLLLRENTSIYFAPAETCNDFLNWLSLVGSFPHNHSFAPQAGAINLFMALFAHRIFPWERPSFLALPGPGLKKLEKLLHRSASMKTTLAFLLMYYCGLSLRETARLRADHFDMSNRLLRLRPHETSLPRVVPFPGILRKEILRLAMKHPREPLFSGCAGEKGRELFFEECRREFFRHIETPRRFWPFLCAKSKPRYGQIPSSDFLNNVIGKILDTRSGT